MLVVDDETDIQDALLEYLGERGYAVELASTLKGGQELLDRGDFDALILDLHLPGANGLTLLEQVRALDPDLCVIIITGHADTTSAIEALRRDADDYLPKPFGLDALDRTLERALERRRLRRRNRALISRLRRVNRALDERVAEATGNLRLLLDLARDLGRNLDLRQTLAGVAEGAARLTHARSALVLLRNPPGEEYEIQARWPLAAVSEPHGPRLAAGLAADSGRLGRPLRHPQVLGPLPAGDPLEALGPGSVLAVPMRWEERTVGTLVLLDRTPEGVGEDPDGPAADFTEEDEELALAFAAHAAVAIRNAQIVEEDRRLARLQSEFVALVSHELRTPLTAMTGSLENLDTYCREQLDPAARRQLAICMQGAGQLEEQIQLIVALAEVETEEQALETEDVEASGLVEEAVRRLRPVAARKGIVIETAAGHPSPLVRVDRRRLVRVLADLLSNAVKFTEHGQPVRVEVEEAGEMVRFHIIDRGIGIDPRDQELIFRPFAQLDGSDTRSTGGTGLGLSVCRAIAERHGGRILVVSRLGQGSRFTVEIPALADEHRQASAA